VHARAVDVAEFVPELPVELGVITGGGVEPGGVGP